MSSMMIDAEGPVRLSASAIGGQCVRGRGHNRPNLTAHTPFVYFDEPSSFCQAVLFPKHKKVYMVGREVKSAKVWYILHCLYRKFEDFQTYCAIFWWVQREISTSMWDECVHIACVVWSDTWCLWLFERAIAHFLHIHIVHWYSN